MILGVPTLDGHEWVQKMVLSLRETVANTEEYPFRLVILDDNSTVPFTQEELDQLDLPFVAEISRSEKVEGYYYPLQTLEIESRLFFHEEYSDPLVGLVHNDIIFYEKCWNVRMTEAFKADSKLGLVGLCGSNEVDHAGTMCFFRGLAQPQSAGLRVKDLRPAVVLDSLFMMFRRSAISDLRMDTDVPSLAHFYDKIWPLRLVQKGWHVAVLGSEVDHWGGITCVANPRFYEACRQWCAERGLPRGADGDPAWGNWNLVMYQEAERRMFEEFKGKLIPCNVNERYEITTADGGVYTYPTTFIPSPWK